MALEQQVSRTREVPLYPKYVLTQETVEYLKKPTFNIWNWEPNEMLCLLEHMYHELGLVTELKINPIILRRWLVSVCVQGGGGGEGERERKKRVCVCFYVLMSLHFCKRS